MRRDRERVGNFVITKQENVDPNCVLCSQCLKILATNEADGQTTPSPELLLLAGAVPVPNFGWFCSQTCGAAYEIEHGTRFTRNAKGDISYYL